MSERRNRALEWARGLGQHQGTLPSIDPATGEVITTLREASDAEIDRAVERARAAFAGPWRSMPRRERSRRLVRIAALIREHADELAAIESLDNGKLFREAREDDIPEAADVFEYYAGWTDKAYGETVPTDPGFLNYVVREPVGVCGLLVPWNFPLLLASWKISAALAMGNTAIVKPSEHTSLSMLRLAEILRADRTLPEGVLEVVIGGPNVGRAISAHRGIDKVSFTGSTGTGRKVLAAAAESNLKTVTLELGGKSPVIVFSDVADLDVAVDRIFVAMFSHKAEKCSEPTRLIVHESIAARAIERLADRAEDVVCGPPFDPRSEQGPQCMQAQLEKVLRYIEIGRGEGRLVCGGRRDERTELAAGLYVRPTIFAEVPASARIFREEIFGPVLTVTSFRTDQEAIDLANGTPYGLAAGLYTSDLGRAHRVAAALEAGMVFVNRYGCYDFASPFGGVKESGWGKEMAVHSLDAYTRRKSVWVATG